MATVK
jgi:hypothetical protein